MEKIPEGDIQTPDQMYTNLKTALAAIVGVDADVLEIVQDEILQEKVDEKNSPKLAVEKLLKLAALRAEEKPDASTAS
jgi:hypothetical protein